VSGRPQHQSSSGRQHHHHHRRSPPGPGSEPERQRLRNNHRSDRDTDPDTDRDERHQSRHPRDLDSSVVVSMSGGESRSMNNSRRHDDNWGETTTVVTGATSDAGYSLDDVRMSGLDKDGSGAAGFRCARYIGAVLAGFVGVVAFLSPIAMLALPKVGIPGWYLSSSTPACEGLLIGVAFKLLILALGSWALFVRRPKSTMPRVFVYRAVVVFLTFVLTFAYWLFFGVRIMFKEENRENGVKNNMEEPLGQTARVDYDGVITFATSFVDALLFIHYLAVILIEVRQMQAQYVVKITRSPDGETHSYTVGQFSVQRLAVWCLEQYYKDFQVI